MNGTSNSNSVLSVLKEAYHYATKKHRKHDADDDNTTIIVLCAITVAVAVIMLLMYFCEWADRNMPPTVPRCLRCLSANERLQLEPNDVQVRGLVECQCSEDRKRSRQVFVKEVEGQITQGEQGESAEQPIASAGQNQNIQTRKAMAQRQQQMLMQQRQAHVQGKGQGLRQMLITKTSDTLANTQADEVDVVIGRDYWPSEQRWLFAGVQEAGYGGLEHWKRETGGDL